MNETSDDSKRSDSPQARLSSWKRVFDAWKRWKKERPWFVPLQLYLATWISTFFVGFVTYGSGTILGGLLFSAPLMIILTLHEAGHYVQSRRYKIAASLPYFIPFPLPPFGTFGAIIASRGLFPDRRALFDVGISGPLAGLVATLIFMVVGLANSTVVENFQDSPQYEGLIFGEPLIFQWTARVILGYDSSQSLLLHPTAVAAWVGLLLTTLNLFPLGQLDGGHVLYALLERRATFFYRALFTAITLGVIIGRLWHWVLMLVLVFFALGVRHPKTADDHAPLGWKRAAIGWLTLGFIFVGFTTNPLDYQEAEGNAPCATENIENSNESQKSDSDVPSF